MAQHAKLGDLSVAPFGFAVIIPSQDIKTANSLCVDNGKSDDGAAVVVGYQLD